MNTKESIAFITCYFGKLPWYFDYFIHSCKYNQSIDFFIISDDVSYTKPLPRNVKLIIHTLEEVRNLASDILGFTVCIDRGYKMCDLKPTYGLIFSELLSRYDFWGHTDIDIIFGDIRQFMTNELLESYDLISVRPDWITGCFLLYRNVEKLNTLFMQSKDYKKVFTSPLHYCFDETNFAHDAFSDGVSYLEINTEIESMMHVVKKMEAIGRLKPYFDLHIIEGLPGRLKWENGKMYYRNKYEILLYHMIYFKKQYNPGKIDTMPCCFTISPTKIYNHKHTKSLVNEL